MLLRLRTWLLAGAPASTRAPLPLRVQRELEHEQFGAELLVTAVQLVLVVLLAALYKSTPAGFSPDAPIEAVPLGLVMGDVDLGQASAAQ